MDPASLIPRIGVINLPWGWFEVLMLVTFVLHLLLMNTALGAAIIAFVHTVTGMDRRSPMAHDVARKLPTSLALTVNFGVAPLLFMQVLYGNFFYVSDVLMAVWWLPVIIWIMIAYYAAYVYDFRYDRLGSWRLAAVAVTMAAMLFVSFLFSNNVTMMMTPESWPRYFDSPTGTLLATADPIFFPRWLHFVTASIALGGLAIALMQRRKLATAEPGGPEAVEAGARLREGMRWFTWATVIQFLVGLWFLLSLKSEVMAMFMGGSGLYTGFFVLALAAAVVALVMGLRRAPVGAAAAVICTVALMAVMRELARQAYLAPYYRPSDLPTSAQYGPLIMFLCALAIGLPVMAWVLTQAKRAGVSADNEEV